MTWTIVLWVAADLAFAFVAWKEKSLLALGLCLLSTALTVERFGLPH